MDEQSSLNLASSENTRMNEVEDESVFTCVVCQSMMWLPTSLPCGHNVCSLCYRGLPIKKIHPPYVKAVNVVECPHCRFGVNIDALQDVRYNYLLNDLIQKLCPKAYAKRALQWTAYLEQLEQKIAHLCADQVVSLEDVALRMRETEMPAYRNTLDALTPQNRVPIQGRVGPTHRGNWSLLATGTRSGMNTARLIHQSVLRQNNPSRLREREVIELDVHGNPSQTPENAPTSPLSTLQEFTSEPTVHQLHYLVSQHLSTKDTRILSLLKSFRLTHLSGGLEPDVDFESALVCQEPTSESDICALLSSLEEQLAADKFEVLDPSKFYELLTAQLLSWSLVLLPELRKATNQCFQSLKFPQYT